MLATQDADLDQLVAAVARRDCVAFRDLYDLSSPGLFATVLRIVRHKPHAEKVLQDVYLRIWRDAEHVTPGGVCAWLNSIARAAAIDLMRQHGSAPVISVSDPTNWYARIAEDHDRRPEMFGVASLKTCLGRIEDPARSCVLLAYFEGLSREELAQRYDCSIDTIKAWLRNGIVSLHACHDASEPSVRLSSGDD